MAFVEEEQMRQARDGHYYIHNQFVNHYSARGDAMWNEANGRGAAEPADEPTAEDVWAAPAWAASRTSSRCPLTPPAFDPAARGVPGDWRLECAERLNKNVWFYFPKQRLC